MFGVWVLGFRINAGLGSCIFGLQGNVGLEGLGVAVSGSSWCVAWKPYGVLGLRGLGLLRLLRSHGWNR